MSKFKAKAWPVTVICSLLISLSHLLQEASSQTYKIGDEVVVTGTKTNKKLIDAPVKTEAINSKSMKSQHIRDISEAVQDIPGVSLTQQTGRSGQSAVIQGLGGDHVLVLIDGIPQGQKSSSGLDLTAISAEDVERVEIVKGAASGLYGSQAIGGVINIITKRPKKKKKYSLGGEFGYLPKNHSPSNKFKSFGAWGKAQGKFNKLGLRLSLSHKHRPAYDLDKSTIPEDSAESQNSLGSLYLDYPLPKKFIIFSHYRINKQVTKMATAKYVPTRGHEKRSNDGKSLSHNLSLGTKGSPFKKGNVKTYANFQKIDDEIYLEDDPATSFVENVKKSKQHSYRWEGQYDRLIATRHFITWGAFFQKSFLDQTKTTTISGTQSYSEKEIGTKSQYSFGTYLQDDIMLSKLEIVPAVRWQKNGSFGQYWAPKLAIRYSPKLFPKDIYSNLRASIGTGYRVPNLKEQYYYLDHRAIANYIVKGNERLNPEKSVSYQLGIEIGKKNKYVFHLNGFLNRIKNMIDVSETDDGSGVRIFQYHNIGMAQTSGFELSFQYNLTEKLNFKADYTYTRSIDVDTKLLIPFRPKVLTSFQIAYKMTPKLESIAQYKFRSDEFTNQKNSEISPQFGLTSLKLSYAVNKDFKLRFGVENLFNNTRGPAQNNTVSRKDNRPARGIMYYLMLDLEGVI